MPLCSRLLLLAAAAIAVSPAWASLMLTQQGVNLGFTLTTFVSGYNATYGPLTQGILPGGDIITGSQFNQRLYIFKDIDNQTLSSALVSVPYACETVNCNWVIATAGGQSYGAQAFGGVYYRFNSDGSFTEIPNLKAQGVRGYLGLWANPVNGHLIAASNFGLVEIDPIAGSYRVINGSLFPDGVSVSPDGTVAYLADTGGVEAYSLITGALIASYPLGGGPDGTGVVIGGALDGRVVINNNDGTLVLLDPAKPAGDAGQFLVIATGGTRGDFLSADTNNGSIFVSQNEQVARLACGPGCSIGIPLTDVPEPTAFYLMGAGLLTLGALRFRPRT